MSTWKPSDLVFVRGSEPADDAPPGYSLWRDTKDGAQGWLSPGDVMKHGLTDALRAGVAQIAAEPLSYTVPEPQEGPREVTEDIDRPERPSQSSQTLGGYSARWRWQKISETIPCPLDTDSDGDCAACGHRDAEARRVNLSLGCVNGKVEVVVWAIDNKPEVEAWAAGDRIDPAPDYQHIAIPDADLRALATTIL